MSSYDYVYEPGMVEVVGGGMHSEECVTTLGGEWGEDDCTCRAPGPEEPRIARLPHRCDEWVIGGVQEVKCLIDDLEKAIEVMK